MDVFELGRLAENHPASHLYSPAIPPQDRDPHTPGAVLRLRQHGPLLHVALPLRRAPVVRQGPARVHAALLGHVQGFGFGVTWTFGALVCICRIHQVWDIPHYIKPALKIEPLTPPNVAKITALSVVLYPMH